jgi:hypothetical protein
MFDSIRYVQIYEKTLSLLSDKAMDGRTIYLHDYKSKNHSDTSHLIPGDKYLTDKYLKAIVSALTNEYVGHNEHSFKYAQFERTSEVARNSLFVEVPFSKIRLQLMEYLRSEILPEERKDAKKDVKRLAKWNAHIKEQFASYEGAAARFDMVKNRLRITALLPQKFRTHGYGSFLSDIKPGDISASKQALEFILSQQHQRGLIPVEFFAQNIFMWLNTQPQALAYEKQISVAPKAKHWISQSVVVKE